MCMLETEARESQVLRSVPRLKVGRVCLIVGIRNERHGLVLEIVPVQTRKERMLFELWRKNKTEKQDTNILHIAYQQESLFTYVCKILYLYINAAFLLINDQISIQTVVCEVEA